MLGCPCPPQSLQVPALTAPGATSVTLLATFPILLLFSLSLCWIQIYLHINQSEGPRKEPPCPPQVLLPLAGSRFLRICSSSVLDHYPGAAQPWRGGFSFL